MLSVVWISPLQREHCTDWSQQGTGGARRCWGTAVSWEVPLSELCMREICPGWKAGASAAFGCFLWLRCHFICRRAQGISPTLLLWSLWGWGDIGCRAGNGWPSEAEEQEGQALGSGQEKKIVTANSQPPHCNLRQGIPWWFCGLFSWAQPSRRAVGMVPMKITRENAHSFTAFTASMCISCIDLSGFLWLGKMGLGKQPVENTNSLGKRASLSLQGTHCDPRAVMREKPFGQGTLIPADLWH